MALFSSLRILLGLSLIVLSSALDVFPLIATTLALGLYLYFRSDGVAWRWVRRARYLLIIPALITAYTSAGTGVIPSLDVWSPTWEGLALGGGQSLRLLVALLALRISLRGLSSESLSQGLLSLFSPLGHIGLNVERAARRLTLTFIYLNRLDGRSARDLLLGVQQRCPPLK